jgi:D-alanine-D-alanine ligase
VDFRLDASGAPQVIDLNPNPCMAPDAGFPAAAARAGLGYPELVGRILDAALRTR